MRKQYTLNEKEIYSFRKMVCAKADRKILKTIFYTLLNKFYNIQIDKNVWHF